MFKFGKSLARGDLLLTKKLGLFVLDDVDEDGALKVRAVPTGKRTTLHAGEVATVYQSYELA